MKIRTDFVTNSSSSSFVAVLELQLENGKKVRATHDNSNGEDDVISYFPGSYRFPGCPLADMKGCYVKNPDQVEKNSPDAWLRIVKGSLRLMCHTYGEEAYRAYPNQMLPELGYEWRTILNQAREYQNEDQLFAYLRGLDALQDYTDKSLHDVVHYIMTDDYINDALIIQRLNENGSLSLSVETASYEDGTLFSLREPRWRPEPSRRLEFITEEEYLRKAHEQKQKEEERRRRAEEKQRQAEESRKQQEEARRLRAEEKQRKAEQARAQQEEARRIRDEEKRRQAELAKQQKERLVEEEKAMRERQRAEALANATILYAPGEEPEKLRKRLDTLFEKLDGAYPDKKISRLNQEHKKWGETVTELYRLLGYPDGQSFLEAYGYTVEKSAMGRKVSVDPVAIMAELHRRYPNDGAESMDTLKRDNPDIPWKTLANNAKEYFGNTLVKHLKSEGIL